MLWCSTIQMSIRLNYRLVIGIWSELLILSLKLYGQSIWLLKLDFQFMGVVIDMIVFYIQYLRT